MAIRTFHNFVLSSSRYGNRAVAAQQLNGSSESHSSLHGTVQAGEFGVSKSIISSIKSS